MKRKPIDPLAAAANCRCQDPQARNGHLYLSPFCAYVEQHKPLAEYGFPLDPISTGAAEYHRAWMAGEMNDSLPPESWPGYRRPDRAEANPVPASEPAPSAKGRRAA